MSGFIPKEQLTAYQRWELAAFDEAQESERQTQSNSVEVSSAAEDVEPPIALPTAEDIERIHAEAHEAGYAAGHEAGYAAGAAEAAAEAQRLQALGDNLRGQLASLDQEIAEELLKVAIEIAGQVLRQTLRATPEAILPIVREATAAMPLHHSHPALYVSPSDAALIRQHLGEQLSHNGWRIIEDAGIEAGGCRAESGASEVDATLATRWKRILEAIGTSADLPDPS